MKKIIALALVGFMFGGVANAASISHEQGAAASSSSAVASQTDAMNIIISASLIESLKITVSNPNMVQASPDVGTLDLGAYNVVDSGAGPACLVNEPGVASSLASSHYTCVRSSNKFSFALKFDYSVELSGGFNIQMDASHIAGSNVAIPEFSNITLAFDAGAAGSTASTASLGHGAIGVLHWTGDLDDQGATQRESTVVLDVVRL